MSIECNVVAGEDLLPSQLEQLVKRVLRLGVAGLNLLVDLLSQLVRAKDLRLEQELFG